MSSPEFISPNTSTSDVNQSSHDSDRLSLNRSSHSPQVPKKLTARDLQRLLQSKPNEYVIIDNPKKHSSDCWTLFGVPARVDNNGHHEQIENFVSCRKCFTSYSFVSNSTRQLNQHKCTTSNERPTQETVTSFFSKRPTTLKINEVSKIKDLQAQWICESVRPFSIVEDRGFRRLVQECISIGNFSITKIFITSFGHLLQVLDMASSMQIRY